VSDKTIVIWDAGRIGRGFVADLFDDAGYRIVLVDQSEELVAHLRQAGRYTVVRAESVEKRGGWPRRPFEPEGDDWSLDAASGLWMGEGEK
jgi:hypothetical protein